MTPRPCRHLNLPQLERRPPSSRLGPGDWEPSTESHVNFLQLARLILHTRFCHPFLLTGADPLDQWKFKVLYDGECPFCRLEVQWLQYLDRAGNLTWEDFAAPDFDPGRYDCNLSDLMGTLHGVFPDGQKTRGMETFREAYQAVGKGWLVAFTGWPVLRPVFDWLYRLFAKYRVHLGRVFGRTCDGDRCSVSSRQ